MCSQQKYTLNKNDRGKKEAKDIARFMRNYRKYITEEYYLYKAVGTGGTGWSIAPPPIFSLMQ